ncbi:MAG: hypothetical protein ACK5RL_08370 [Acidimicrobiales bacterium]
MTDDNASDNLDSLRRQLDETFDDYHKAMGDVFVAFERVRTAGPTDDVESRLAALEDAVKKVRTGGLFGTGVRSHRKARERWLEAGGKPA